MAAKILIVEDEPIIALDLEMKVTQFGFEVVAIARSADEALRAVEDSRPDLALMDLHILGSMDGIETAHLLRSAYEIPSIFLTAYSDDRNIERATRGKPYGFMTKPFETRELKAMIQVTLEKTKVDADERRKLGSSSSALNGMHEALVALSLDGDILLMNAPAEKMAGVTGEDAIGRNFRDVLDLQGPQFPRKFFPGFRGLSGPIEHFGLTLSQPRRGSVLVDLALSPTVNGDEVQTGYVLTLRKADQRLRSEALKDSFHAVEDFELALIPMVQLDSSGQIIRVNEAMLHESGTAEGSLVGRTLGELSRDPDPRISGRLMHRLLRSASI
jgi:CheY-like chemotaxis protein